MRRDAREAVFSLLFKDLFNEESDLNFKKKIYSEHKLTESDVEFANLLYDTVKSNYESLLLQIEELSQGFKLNRIFNTDKCALLIGMCEMTYMPEIPKIVAIDEAVALSKKYSTEKSQQFVNGILAEYKKRYGIYV